MGAAHENTRRKITVSSLPSQIVQLVNIPIFSFGANQIAAKLQNLNPKSRCCHFLHSHPISTQENLDLVITFTNKDAAQIYLAEVEHIVRKWRWRAHLELWIVHFTIKELVKLLKTNWKHQYVAYLRYKLQGLDINAGSIEKTEILQQLLIPNSVEDTKQVESGTSI